MNSLVLETSEWPKLSESPAPMNTAYTFQSLTRSISVPYKVSKPTSFGNAAMISTSPMSNPTKEEWRVHEITSLNRCSLQNDFGTC